MKKTQIGNTEFSWGERTYVMGILNVTPDSFSGDGVFVEKNFVQAAVAQAQRFVSEGAHILDVGGESTRPGSEPVSEAEELRRVIPVVRALSQMLQIPISVDTYKANVAREAIAAGAHCINDVWGGTKDAAMYSVAAELRAPIVLMHNSTAGQQVYQDAQLGSRFVGADSKDIVDEVSRELRSLAEAAQAHGVSPKNIILDPGFGFGKTVEQNLELVRRIDELKTLGYPILAGISRKSFVGYTLDLPPSERVEGTLAAAVLCAERGADILRVHDVQAVRRALDLTDAVVREN
jgi:dihydropteroate synthase